MEIGRNDPCPCKSGKKYKKCCLKKEAPSPTVSALSRAEKKQLIKSSDKLPLAQCVINSDWQESGLANILVTRRQGNGNLIMAAYLVDTGCLGLKSTFCNADLSPEKVASDLLPKQYPDRNSRSLEIDHAQEIIFGAIGYAAKLGFDPDPDFNLSRYVLGPEILPHHRNIRFGGKDGKPFYVAGPNDDAPRVIQKLTERLGKDNFDFTAPLVIPD